MPDSTSRPPLTITLLDHERDALLDVAERYGADPHDAAARLLGSVLLLLGDDPVVDRALMKLEAPGLVAVTTIRVPSLPAEVSSIQSDRGVP